METITLTLKSALFDNKSAIELSKRTSPHTLWSIKLSITSFYIGLVVGGYRSSLSRAKQFTVENFHLLPTSKRGWYMYHRYKNYSVIKSFIQNGIKSGLRLSSWTLLYCVADGFFISMNGEHVVNGAFAGLSTGSLFCLTRILLVM